MDGYELMDRRSHSSYSWWRLVALIFISLVSTVLVFLVWHAAYNDEPRYPPLGIGIITPTWWLRRANIYSNSFYPHHDFRLLKNQRHIQQDPDSSEEFLNSSLATTKSTSSKRLICYYSSTDVNTDYFSLSHVDPQLCTHINIGMVYIRNSQLVLNNEIINILNKEVPLLRAKNPQLKLLLWVGGGDTSGGFSDMIKTHKSRKLFIESLRLHLREFKLDGVDLDWEFPSAYNKERLHFSQLLYEIRQEYKRQKREYLLSVAVAAPEGIALFAYDVPELNKYADFVNLMTYDYHFYMPGAPFTGLNAPLYARANEHSILGVLNINYSVNWWIKNGMDRDKLILGLPTYGHSFTLVNPFNKAIGAPAEGIGRCGSKGFTTYSDICWFKANNIFVTTTFDQQTCSPYMSSGTEWISFENEASIECKTRYAKMMKLGGVMVFSLNTDDLQSFCKLSKYRERMLGLRNASFPLIEAAKRVLVG